MEALGARREYNFSAQTSSYGHITVKAPHPIRTAKLSTVGPDQYFGRGLQGNLGCCMALSFLFFFFLKIFLFTKEIKRKVCRHLESHRGYRRHKPGYCYYTIAASFARGVAVLLLQHPEVLKMEDPGIDPGSQPCEGCMLPCTTIPQTECVHRDSNPNLNLGRVKYYPCTMDAVSERQRASVHRRCAELRAVEFVASSPL